MTPEVPLIVPDTQQDITRHTFASLELSPKILHTTLGGTEISVKAVNGKKDIPLRRKKRLLAIVLRGFPDFEEAKRFGLRTHEYYGQPRRKK